MGKRGTTRQVAEVDLDDDDAAIREPRMPARVRRRFMTDLIEQTAEQNPRLSDAKFANNSLSNAVVSELGTQDVMVSFGASSARLAAS